ncbi:MAG: LysR family transcriptional regulator [Pleurocapsa sp.]
MDKFESMYAFTQVVKEGSFAAAARKMQMSRSAVNKLVINLENLLKIQLLYRTTRQVTLTDTGKAYYERCLSILADVEEAELAVSQQHKEPKGLLKINAPLSFGISALASKIAEFTSRYEELKVQLILEDRFVDPISEGYDVIIRIGSPPSSSNLIVEEIASLERVICAAPSYLEAKGIPEHPQELQNHSCLHYGYLETGDRWLFSNKNENLTISIDGVLCSNNGEVLRDAAIKGLGIVMLPMFLVQKELNQGKLQIILEDHQLPRLSLCLIYPVNRHLSTKIQLFTEFIKHYFKSIA